MPCKNRNCAQTSKNYAQTSTVDSEQTVPVATKVWSQTRPNNRGPGKFCRGHDQTKDQPPSWVVVTTK